jgi:hypothetical protein
MLVFLGMDFKNRLVPDGWLAPLLRIQEIWDYFLGPKAIQSG